MRSYKISFSGGGPLEPAASLENSVSLLPLHTTAMANVRDFVAGLARAGKSCKDIKNHSEGAFGDKTLTEMTIQNISNKVKAGKNTDDQRRRERILRGQSGNQQCVRVYQTRVCPTPLSSKRVCPPPAPKVGVHTRRALRGLGGHDFGIRQPRIVLYLVPSL